MCRLNFKFSKEYLRNKKFEINNLFLVRENLDKDIFYSCYMIDSITSFIMLIFYCIILDL